MNNLHLRMPPMRTLVTFLASSALALTLLVAPQRARAQDRELATKGVLLDRIAAIVNDGVVLNSDLEQQIEVVSERLREQKLDLPPQNVLRQQVLERLVVQEIQIQHADKAGIKVPDETLNSALQEVAQRNHITFSQLPDVLSQQGIDYAIYRDEMRRELVLGLLRQRDVLQRISVTPREIDQYLEKQAKTPDEHNEYNVSHILIAVAETATPDQIEEAGKKAQDVYKRAKGGEDFAKLAVANSNSQTALEGGALGWRKGSELPTFLTDLIVKLKPGEVSEPLRTPTGYHIIKLNDVRIQEKKAMEDQVHARHILMKTNELQDDATVQQKLSALRDRILKGEDFAGLAQTTSQDPSSQTQGGDLGWADPQSYAPDFQAAIAPLQDNEISVPFHTQFGWHIVQMLGRRRIDNTDEVRRHEAAEAIRASKADEETELWLRRLRDESYVEYKS
jgi:peptidyl-prolyl cis-trans isomerase SurA